ncbi:MAG: nucleoside 2-deoxyribosyltransferase domain-containing protein [Candidatus Nanoarchaeia archaeon]|nr:nucleoside 2-deoxyribosyltransferase domain-containing protein [Candidatus Nanoarchaeia archaeon]
MSKIVEAPEKYTPKRNEISLFLAGGITSCPDWQKEIIKLFEEVPDLVMYNPRRKNFPIHDPTASKKQITWEYNYLESSDMILFWFAKGSLNPIVLYELGKWGNSSPRQIFIGMDKEYERQSDVIIQTELARPEIEIVYSIKDLALQVLNYINEGEIEEDLLDED